MKTVIVILLSLLAIIVIAVLLILKISHHQLDRQHLVPQNQAVKEKKITMKDVINHPKNLPTVAKKSALNIPASYHPVKGILQQTIYVGTIDHPTINGGIINAPGVAVNRDLPQSFSTAKKLTEDSNSKVHLVLTSNTVEKAIAHSASESFSDHWATSERVGWLLQKAAQEGKLSYVLKKTNEMGLPANLAIVPMVESDYQTHAVSTKGAAGAWQLMPSTAKDYGLSQQDRFQFPLATDAALKLLNDLHRQFGNWQLAFAAYNAGSQRVKIALAKNPDAQTIDELDLPSETKIYVKRIMNLNQTMISMENQHV